MTFAGSPAPGGRRPARAISSCSAPPRGLRVGAGRAEPRALHQEVGAPVVLPALDPADAARPVRPAPRGHLSLPRTARARFGSRSPCGLALGAVVVHANVCLGCRAPAGRATPVAVTRVCPADHAREPRGRSAVARRPGRDGSALGGRGTRASCARRPLHPAPSAFNVPGAGETSRGRRVRAGGRRTPGGGPGPAGPRGGRPEPGGRHPGTHAASRRRRRQRGLRHPQALVRRQQRQQREDPLERRRPLLPVPPSRSAPLGSQRIRSTAHRGMRRHCHVNRAKACG